MQSRRVILFLVAAFSVFVGKQKSARARICLLEIKFNYIIRLSLCRRVPEWSN